MKLMNTRSQFTIMDNTEFYLPTHSFSHILSSFEGVRYSRDNGYICRKERPKECGIFNIISAWTNESFHRGNSTQCNSNWRSVNTFYESQILTLLLSISWLSSRKLWVLVALPLVGWGIYIQDSDFTASDSTEGDWAEWIKKRLQPNESTFSEQPWKIEKNVRFRCKRSVTHSAQFPVILGVWSWLSLLLSMDRH